jgi:hypothetical protein
MIVAAVKHFCAVGLLFSLALGWLATMIVNGIIGNVIEAASGRPATDPYWGALLLTVVSLALICGAIWVGNRLYRAGAVRPLSAGAVVVSALCYLVLVSVMCVPQIAASLSPVLNHLQYANRHPQLVRERMLMLSLPALRMAVLATWYFFSALPLTNQRTAERADRLATE